MMRTEGGNNGRMQGVGMIGRERPSRLRFNSAIPARPDISFSLAIGAFHNVIPEE